MEFDMKVLAIIPSLNLSDITPRMEEWLNTTQYIWTLAPEKGYGYAIQQVMKASPNYDCYLVLDSDMAMDVRHIDEMVSLIEAGWDVIVGTRQTNQSIVKRTWLRAKVSKAYNKWCQLLFDSELSEHLCGFRAYSGRVVRDCILPLVEEKHWIWQCETVVIPEIMGYAVGEIPIDWTEYRYNRTPMKRLFKDIYQMGIRTFKLWLRWRYYAQ